METEKIFALPLTTLGDITISLLKVEQPPAFKEILGRVMKDSGLVFDDEDPVEFLVRYIEERKASVGTATIGSTIAEIKRTAGPEATAIPSSFEAQTIMTGGSYSEEVFFAICSIVMILSLLFFTLLASVISGAVFSVSAQRLANFPTINSVGATVPGVIGFLIPFIVVITRFVSSELRGDTPFIAGIASPFITPFIALNRALQPKRYLYVVHEIDDARAGTVAILYFSAITGKILTDELNNIKYSLIQDYNIWPRVGWAHDGLQEVYRRAGYEVYNLLHVPRAIINANFRVFGTDYVDMTKDQFDTYLRRVFREHQDGFREHRFAQQQQPQQQQPQQQQPQQQPQAQQADAAPGRRLPRPAGRAILEAFHNSATVPEPPELANTTITDPVLIDDITPGTKYAFVDFTPPVFALTWDYFQKPDDVNSLFHIADGSIIRRAYDPITENGEIQLSLTGERVPATQLKWTIRAPNINNVVNEIVNILPRRRRTQAENLQEYTRNILSRGRQLPQLPNSSASAASGRRLVQRPAAAELTLGRRGRSATPGRRGGKRTIRRKSHKGRRTRHR